MKKAVAALARWLWSDFERMSERERGWHLVELGGIAASLPLVIISSVWLISATDLNLLQRQWPLFLLLVVAGILISRISFFQIVGRHAGSYSYNSSDLEDIIAVSSIFILGPSAVWVHFLSRVVYFLTEFPRLGDRAARLNWLRNLLFNLWSANFSLLTAAFVYQALGGQTPPPGLTLNTVWAGLVAVLVEFGFSALFIWGLLSFHLVFLGEEERSRVAARQGETVRFFVLAGLPTFFAILAATIYGQMGTVALVYFLLGMLAVSALARRLSQAAVLSQQQGRQIAQVEELGRAIISSPPDGSGLPELLTDFMPRMFDYDLAEIRLHSGEVLLHQATRGEMIDDQLWAWSKKHPQAVFCEAGEPLPWKQGRAETNLLLVPILEAETANPEPLGAIVLESRGLSRTMAFRASLTALQVLGAQISSTLHRAEVYARELAYERVAQELAFARQIQESFLPEQVPQRPGWEIAATLQPARTTSGDFYDVFELDRDKLGLLIADVADKGLGAAMFMAFSRTLLRTYAQSDPDRPGEVLRAVNERILADAHNDMFVTVFYAVLDTQSGCLSYANAGHDPALLVGDEAEPRLLSNTGIPLGIHEEARWRTVEVSLAPGETLLLYTDGVTDAHREDYEMFGARRLQQLARQKQGLQAAVMQQIILQEVQQFTRGHPQADDITTLVLQRTANGQRPAIGN